MGQLRSLFLVFMPQPYKAGRSICTLLALKNDHRHVLSTCALSSSSNLCHNMKIPARFVTGDFKR
jgi:hypothetical protein